MVQTRMIQIIKQNTIFGFALSVDTAAYDYFPVDKLTGSAYTVSLQLILGAMRAWLSVSPEVTRMAYFFEAGHKSQGEANKAMEKIFLNKEDRKALRYSGHAFIDKRKAAPVQAADLLAWQWYIDRKKQTKGEHRRRDCARLMEHPHLASHIGTADAQAIRQAIRSDSPDLGRAIRQLLGRDLIYRVT